MSFVLEATLFRMAVWSLGALTLTAMASYPWLTRFSRIWFCSSTVPVGGCLMSTRTLPSFSYLCTPLEAIFQKSLALLVTNASLSVLPPSRLHPGAATHALIPTAASTASTDTFFHTFDVFTFVLLVPFLVRFVWSQEPHPASPLKSNHGGHGDHGAPKEKERGAAVAPSLSAPCPPCSPWFNCPPVPAPASLRRELVRGGGPERL